VSREADFAIEAHWRCDTRDVIQLGNALAHLKPMWLEDPVPPDKADAMARVAHATGIPICTGENLYTRQGFRRLIEFQACAGVRIDIPKSGGLLESKRIADLADTYYLWTAAHNPASPVGTIASAHAASSIRDFRIHELAKYIDWWQDLVIHEGPIFKDGYLIIQDKPGYGIELNPDVARAHLAPDEAWWGRSKPHKPLLAIHAIRDEIEEQDIRYGVHQRRILRRREWGKQILIEIFVQRNPAHFDETK
jgi:gluconate/galactonate dehydratase